MTPEQDITARQNRLCTAALDAEQGGRLRDAARSYREAIRLDPGNPAPDLFYGFVLQRLGEQEAAVQTWSLGADLDSNFINAWRFDRVDELVRQRSKAANDALRSHFTAQHTRCVDEYRDARFRSTRRSTRPGSGCSKTPARKFATSSSRHRTRPPVNRRRISAQASPALAMTGRRLPAR
ncbi:MAG: hypothetical protein P8X81_12375 [Woeseiaceae bacterium]